MVADGRKMVQSSFRCWRQSSGHHCRSDSRYYQKFNPQYHCYWISTWLPLATCWYPVFVDRSYSKSSRRSWRSDSTLLQVLSEKEGSTLLSLLNTSMMTTGAPHWYNNSKILFWAADAAGGQIVRCKYFSLSLSLTITDSQLVQKLSCELIFTMEGLFAVIKVFPIYASEQQCDQNAASIPNKESHWNWRLNPERRVTPVLMSQLTSSGSSATGQSKCNGASLADCKAG